MVQLELNVTIDQPIDKVFRYVSNEENLQHWAEVALNSRQVTEGPVQVGTQAEVDIEFSGIRVTAVFEVTEYEENRLFAFRTSNAPFNLKNVYRFSPVNGGGSTRIDVTSMGEGRGIPRFVEVIAAKMLDRQFTKDHERLRKILENGNHG